MPRMRLWKLIPKHDSPWWGVPGDDPWHPHHDRAFGFVVRAGDEAAARRLAHGAAGEENAAVEGVEPWLDARYSDCDELGDGPAEVLMVNFRHRD